MLHCFKHYIDNDLVKFCFLNAIGNANCITGYKITHFREQFNINTLDVDVNSCKQHVRPLILIAKRQSIVN